MYDLMTQSNQNIIAAMTTIQGTLNVKNDYEKWLLKSIELSMKLNNS